MSTPAPDCQPPPYPRRFSWPMRLFLTVFLASITYRCFDILMPIDQWTDAYDVRKYPEPLSSLDELHVIAAKASSDEPHPVLDDLMNTADSVYDYWKPWPEAKTRAKIKTWDDGAKVAASWVHWHIGFVEHVCAIDEGWPMFSPSLATDKEHTRARLFFADDSDFVVRQNAEPADYAHYWRWFSDKRGNYERRADDDDARACQGYCNVLQHRYPQNANGSKLVKIVLFKVKVMLPDTKTDPKSHYEEQNRLTESPPRLPGTFRSDRSQSSPQVLPDFYEYDVAEQKGTLLKVEK